MKLSDFIEQLQDLKKEKGNINIPNNAINNIYMPLYTKNHKGDAQLSYDYLKSVDDLFDYLIMELEIEPTKKVKEAYSMAYESHHSSGQVEVYWEFCKLLDLLEIKYKDLDEWEN